MGWARPGAGSLPDPDLGPGAVSPHLCPPPCPATTLTAGDVGICTHQKLQGRPQPSEPLAHSSTPSSAQRARLHRPPPSPPSPFPASEGPLWVPLWPCQATTQFPPISRLPTTLDSKPSLVLLGTQPTTRRFEMRAGAGPARCTPPHPGLNANAPHHCPSHLPGGTEQPTRPLRAKLTPAPPQPTLSDALQTHLDLSTPQTHFTPAQGRP